jgi:hypothetical protein
VPVFNRLRYGVKIKEITVFLEKQYLQGRWQDEFVYAI